MKLFYKIIIPIAISFIFFFAILLTYIIHLEEEVITKFQNSVRTVSNNEFENKKSEILQMENDYLEFISFLASKISFKYLYNYDYESIIKPLSKFVTLKSIEAISIYDSSNNNSFITLIQEDDKAYKVDKLPEFFDSYTKFTKTMSELNDNGENEIYGYVTIYYNDFSVEKKIDKQHKKTLQTLEKVKEQTKKDIDEVFKNQILFILAIAVILSFIVFLTIQKMILFPLDKLKIGLDSFFLFLQNKKSSTQRIELDTKDEFGQMANSLNDNIEVSTKLHEEINELNVNLEQLVEEKTQKVNTLLNNAGQGFLSFGTDFIIDNEYSQECLNIIGIDISGKKISNLLFNDEEKKKFFEDILLDTLEESEEIVLDSLISLLPNMLMIDKKSIKLEYKLLDNSEFMLILTDISSQKILEKKIKDEEEMLKMIVAIVSNKDVFFDLKNDYEKFCDTNIESVDSSKIPSSNLNGLYRNIHTFKGTFLQLYMKNSANYLHYIETLISELIQNTDTTNNDILLFLSNSNFKNCMKKDLQIIKNVLGEVFLKSEKFVTVSKKSIKDIKSKISTYTEEQKIPSDLSKELLTSIQQMVSVYLINILNVYPKMTYQLAHRIEKEIYEFKIIGDSNLVVPVAFKPIIKSLIHIFRNSVDHGIESPDTRVNNNKDETGTISCSFEVKNNILQIIIADDGAGIDTQKIKQKLLDNNIDTDNFSENDYYKYIFEDNFTTKEEITDVSGRGMGMSAVKVELDKLNGNYEIQSVLNVGTTFIFNIPLNASYMNDVFEHLLDADIRLLAQRVGIDIIEKKIEIVNFNEIKLKKTNVLIYTSGYIDSTIIVSYDDDILNKFAGDFMDCETLSVEEQNQINQSVACEVANILVGKSLVSPNNKDIIIITPPALINNTKSLTQYEYSKIQMTTFTTKLGNIQVYYNV